MIHVKKLLEVLMCHQQIHLIYPKKYHHLEDNYQYYQHLNVKHNQKLQVLYNFLYSGQKNQMNYWELHHEKNPPDYTPDEI